MDRLARNVESIKLPGRKLLQKKIHIAASPQEIQSLFMTSDVQYFIHKYHPPASLTINILNISTYWKLITHTASTADDL